jgi:alkanesulfonate monooxygenase SsuD/methylene tetrahydromethanopterin reductase-like flavin-dependent oxidoreductase (luciferase family)
MVARRPEKTRIGVKPGQWGWTFAELLESWRRAEELGFDIVSTFDHVTAAPEGFAAWDAPSLLVAMAAETERVRLAVDVLNTSLRHPFLLAGQLAVAQAASGGRLEVGLGLGSWGLARHDHRALGIPFPPREQRIARLRACCRVFPRLWRGEGVSDFELQLEHASLGPIAITPPPLIVGGTSDAVIAVAAEFADGWNAVVSSAAEYAALARRADDLCAEVGRQRPLARAVQVFVPAIDLGMARELVAGLVEAGADSVTFVLVEGGVESVADLAAAVL